MKNINSLKGLKLLQKEKKPSTSEIGDTFITQEKKVENPLSEVLKPKSLPFTKKDFLDVLKNLEENNIFMFQNIQHDEEDLEKFKAESALKVRKA
jgi:hypothetical protein